MADTTYVKMPQEDYIGLREAVQEKNGETGPYTSGTLIEKVEALETVNDVTVVNCGNSSTVVAGGA